MINTSIILKTILSIYLGALINALNLFFIGDSFDRNWVNEWCEENPNTYHRYTEKANFVHPYGLIWSDTKFNDHDNRTPFFCRDDSNNDTVAQIQIFGSNLNCPYYHDRTGSMDGTEFRIRRALGDYFVNFGMIPDRIILHTVQWDAPHYFHNVWNRVMPSDVVLKAMSLQNQKQLHTLVDLVQSIVNVEVLRRQKLVNNHPSNKNYSNFKVDIGFRSTTRASEHPELNILLDEIAHNVTIKHNLTWYDYDQDFWSTVDYHRTPHYYTKLSPLFRDWIHGIRPYSTPTINKLLGRQYSQFFVHGESTQRLSHIITTAERLNSDQYKSVNFQLVRSLSNEDNMNDQIAPIRDINKTNITHSIPGYGPIYFSMFVNNTRVKWLIGDLSAQYYAQLVHQHKVTHTVHHKFNHTKHHFNPTTDTTITNAQYELTMRPILENLLLSVSDLVLLSAPLLDTISTQGVMPVLFTNISSNSIKLSAFIFPPRQLSSGADNHDNNNTDIEIILVSPAHHTHRLVPPPIVPFILKLIHLNHIPTTYCDTPPLWMIKSHEYQTQNISHLFRDNALIRHHSSKSVFLVRNLTRHSFNGLKSFTSRGFDFSDVIVYDNLDMFYVDLMSIGKVLV